MLIEPIFLSVFVSAPDFLRNPQDVTLYQSVSRANHAVEPQQVTRKGSGTTAKRLPDAGGRTFETLDAYLEHLRQNAAPLDRPWYREVRPGVYQLETGNYRPLGGAGAPRQFTRAELMARFGFTR